MRIRGCLAVRRGPGFSRAGVCQGTGSGSDRASRRTQSPHAALCPLLPHTLFCLPPPTRTIPRAAIPRVRTSHPVVVARERPGRRPTRLAAKRLFRHHRCTGARPAGGRSGDHSQDKRDEGVMTLAIGCTRAVLTRRYAVSLHSSRSSNLSRTTFKQNPRPFGEIRPDPPSGHYGMIQPSSILTLVTTTVRRRWSAPCLGIGRSGLPCAIHSNLPPGEFGAKAHNCAHTRRYRVSVSHHLSRRIHEVRRNTVGRSPDRCLSRVPD